MFNFNYILLSLILVLDLTLGLIVFLKNPKNPINQRFFNVTFWTMIWVLSNFIENESSSKSFGPLLLKIDFAAAIILAYYFCSFCINFPKALKFSFIKKIIFVLPALLLFILSFSSLVIKNINFIDGAINFERGGLYWLYALVVIGYTGGGSLNLFLRLKKMIGLERTQTLYILLGFAITAILAIYFNLILTQVSIISVEINRIGIYGFLFFIIFTTYAILKRRLFNIKVIATELLTFAIWIFLLMRTLLAETLRELMLNGTLLILVILFGILLIKSVIREVEQREKLEGLTKELKATNEKLKQLDKLKSEFLSFASHQVKTPMTIVKGFAQLIYDETLGLVSDKIKEAAKKIKDSADRMIALVDNLLNLRKIEEGKMEYNFAGTDINELVKAVVEELKLMAQDKKLELIFSGLVKEIKIQADSQKLRQVIQNIVHNAVKYTDKGWVRVSIKYQVSSIKNKEGVLIAVSDSGRGISPELQSHLFEQFSRDSETAKEIQGTGLGLYIAKQIVEAHQGRIWVESEGENKGSTFYVEMPNK